ncbi:hypothetical protein ACM614_13720, partial [Streptomyces sp. 12297]
MNPPTSAAAPARTLCLDDPATLLYVESGAADLFAVERGPDGGDGDGEEHGRRYFLCRAEAGMIVVCGTGGASRHTVIARPVLDARLSRLPLTLLDDVRQGRATLPRPDGV